MISVEVRDLASMEILAARMAVVAKIGDVITFSGDLGAGKSVLARAFLRARGAEGDIPSPTFTLVQQYDLSDGAVFHFDLYRLKNAVEIEEIGFDDALADGMVLIEWPEKAESYIPRDALRVRIEITGDQTRTVHFDVPEAYSDILSLL